MVTLSVKKIHYHAISVMALCTYVTKRILRYSIIADLEPLYETMDGKKFFIVLFILEDKRSRHLCVIYTWFDKLSFTI